MKKRKKESRKMKILKKKSRRFSIRDGIFSSIRQALGDSYISPFAIAINASNSLIALLSSIPGLLGPLSQWFSSRLIEKYPRKKIISIAILFEILMWIPLILIAFLFYKGILVSSLPFILLIFFSLYIIFAHAGHPAWFSWMGDLVNEEKRGRWFAKRNFFFGMTLLIFSILASVFLDFLKKKEYLMFGFMVLFFLGITARFIARIYIKKQYEPKLKLKKGYYFSIFEFIKKANSNNFGRFAIFRSFLSIATGIASPFFAVYMLRSLGFSYFIFILVTMAQIIFSLIAIRKLGRFADKFGNFTLIKITSLMITFYPVLWLISNSPIYLISVTQLIGGIGWAGFHLAAGNFIFDSVTPQKRSLAVSYYNVLNGLGIFIGAMIGAILIKYIGISFMDKFLYIFLISGFARLTVSLIMIPKIKEIRKTKKWDSSKALKNMVFKTARLPIDIGTNEIFPKKTHKK